jgi:lysozyme
MDIPITNLEQQLIRDEGEVLHAYPDSKGYLTIGCGRMIDERKDGGISKDESDYLLDNDIAKVTERICTRFPWANAILGPRFAVLQNMCFNMGIEGLDEFKLFLAAMEANDWNEASRQMLNSTWAKQVGNRATRLSVQVVTGEWQ